MLWLSGIGRYILIAIERTSFSVMSERCRVSSLLGQLRGDRYLDRSAKMCVGEWVSEWVGERLWWRGGWDEMWFKQASKHMQLHSGSAKCEVTDGWVNEWMPHLSFFLSWSRGRRRRRSLQGLEGGRDGWLSRWMDGWGSRDMRHNQKSVNEPFFFSDARTHTCWRAGWLGRWTWTSSCQNIKLLIVTRSKFLEHPSISHTYYISA